MYLTGRSSVLIFFIFDVLITTKLMAKYYDPPPAPNGFYWGSTSGLEAILVKIGPKIEVFYVTIKPQGVKGGS